MNKSAFKTRKNFGKFPHPTHKRVPRKFKKEWKHIIQGNRYNFLDLGQKLWFIRWQTNPEYNRFIINQITKDNVKK